jgi:hypothetical protein
VQHAEFVGSADEDNEECDEADEASNSIITKSAQVAKDDSAEWSQFIERVGAGVKDPVVQSIFKQAFFVSFDAQEKQVQVEFLKDLAFFKDIVQGAKASWQPLLEECFGAGVVLKSQFSLARQTQPMHKVTKDAVPEKNSVQAKAPIPVVQKEQRSYATQQAQRQQQYRASVKPATARMPYMNEKSIDVSDENMWKIAPMLLRHFPGTITEVREHR